MSKSVFQQLVEQTCSNANFKPSNNKAAQQPTNRKSNGTAKSVTNPSAPSSKPETRNSKLSSADRAPRCQHIKANGVQCKSPAMRELPFCFFHEKFYNPPYDDSFPPLEDANSVQCAILQVLNLLKTKSITPLEARVMLYGLKAASINSRRTTFEPIMQAQVTEYPSFRRAQEELQQSTAADRVVIASASEAPSRDQASQMQDFLRAVREESSPAGPKPPATVPAPRIERENKPAAVTSN